MTVWFVTYLPPFVSVSYLIANVVPSPGMYDPTPGNFWFGRKWFYILSNPVPKCPDDLTTTGNNAFVNDQGEVEDNMKLICLE